MLQTRVSGKDATQFLESLTTGDLKNLGNGCAVLTVFTDENGGILDDLIVTKDGEDKYFLVSNAGRRKEDSRLLLQQQVDDKARFILDWRRKKRRKSRFFCSSDSQEIFLTQGKSVSLEFLDPLKQSLVALQGPTAASVLQSIVDVDLRNLRFMNSVETEMLGARIRITRCGYTGEDGFEISIPVQIARTLVKMILNTPDTKLAGLGARDSLR